MTLFLPLSFALEAGNLRIITSLGYSWQNQMQCGHLKTHFEAQLKSSFTPVCSVRYTQRTWLKNLQICFWIFASYKCGIYCEVLCQSSLRGADIFASIQETLFQVSKQHEMILIILCLTYLKGFQMISLNQSVHLSFDLQVKATSIAQKNPG